VLFGHANCPASELVNVGGLSFLCGMFQVLLSLLPPLNTLLQLKEAKKRKKKPLQFVFSTKKERRANLSRLHPRWLAIKHIHRLDTTLNHANGAVEEPCQMTIRQREKREKTVKKFFLNFLFARSLHLQELEEGQERSSLPCDFSSFVCELLSFGPDSDEELVETHGGVNGNLPAKVVLDLMFLYGLRRVVSNHSRKTVDSHN